MEWDKRLLLAGGVRLIDVFRKVQAGQCKGVIFPSVEALRMGVVFERRGDGARGDTCCVEDRVIGGEE